jgi:hypothetical protein
LLAACVKGRVEAVSIIVPSRGAISELYVDDNVDFQRGKCKEVANGKFIGFAYFPYLIETEARDTGLREFIECLGELVNQLTQNGCKVVITCDFEDEVILQLGTNRFL